MLLECDLFSFVGYTWLNLTRSFELDPLKLKFNSQTSEWGLIAALKDAENENKTERASVFVYYLDVLRILCLM